MARSRGGSQCARPDLLSKQPQRSKAEEQHNAQPEQQRAPPVMPLPARERDGECALCAVASQAPRRRSRPPQQPSHHAWRNALITALRIHATPPSPWTWMKFVCALSARVFFHCFSRASRQLPHSPAPIFRRLIIALILGANFKREGLPRLGQARCTHSLGLARLCVPRRLRQQIGRWARGIWRCSLRAHDVGASPHRWMCVRRPDGQDPVAPRCPCCRCACTACTVPQGVRVRQRYRERGGHGD